MKNDNNSFAFEVLQDLKKQSKRLFIIILILILTNVATMGYLIYTLNDIGYYTEDTQEIEDVEVISGSVIDNG